MYVSMAVVLQAVVCGVGAGGFCEGLSQRPFPLVCVNVTLDCPLACCLLPVFPPTELPFPRPLLLFDMHRLYLDHVMLSPGVGLHGPPLLPCCCHFSSLLPTALCALPCPRRQAHAAPKMI